jgi:hypothetical protein
MKFLTSFFESSDTVQQQIMSISNEDLSVVFKFWLLLFSHKRILQVQVQPATGQLTLSLNHSR